MLQTQQPTVLYFSGIALCMGFKPLSMKTRLVSAPIFTLCLISLISACFGGIGLIFSIIGFYMAHKKINQAQQNPLGYSGSLETMKLAKIASLITFAVNLFYIGYTAIWISNHGYEAFQDRWLNMLLLR